MYCIVSKESVAKMNGIRGKMMAQAGHAFLHAYMDSANRFPKFVKAYHDSKHAKKITLVVETDLDLINLYKKYSKICGATKVVDAGFTVFTEPTLTCIGIGPIQDEDIFDDLKKLPLFT